MIRQERYAHAVFCDDIRHEVGGKFTAVGMYGGNMIIAGKPPIDLPKLACMIWASTPVKNPFKQIKFEISGSAVDGSIMELEPTDLEPGGGDGADARALVMTVMPIFSGVKIKNSGDLTVTVKTESEEMIATRLMVKFDESSQE